MKAQTLTAFPFNLLNRKRRVNDGKYGVIKGVFLPDILQMIGVILFLRLGWILGHVGIVETSVIISLSSIILLITGLSVAAIATNMRIGAGGSYYIISRSLGVEFGSSIGILICISQTTSIALCVSGFAVSLHEFFPDFSLPLIEVVTLVFLGVIAYISTNLALQTQILIFCALMVSLITIFTGDASNIPESLAPSDTFSSMPFWIAFAMFFPAATGIESGMSMSGDLRNPSRAIPWGTLGAILMAYLLYLSIALFLSHSVSPAMLRSHPFIIYHLSKAGYLIVMGIWAATLSSAFGGILGAPRVMQAIANDGILPKFLGKGFGKTKQPRIATIVVFIMALILTVFTQINVLIPILTMVCLVTYGLLNFVAFFEELIQNPSWRPSFRVPWIISLVGSLGCFMAMFMITAGGAFLVLAAVIAICLWSSMRQVKGNWEDIRASLFSYLVNKGIKKLQTINESAKTWRPHLLAFIDIDTPNKRDLISFSHSLNQNKGFLTFALALPEVEKCGTEELHLKQSIHQFLEDTHVPAFTHINHNKSVFKSMNEVVSHYGLGPLTPNTYVVAYNEHFLQKNDQIIDFIYNAYSHEKNVIILKSVSEMSTSFLELDKGKSQKDIHLWFEGKVLNNFKLSLALAHIFQSSPALQSANICVNALITDEDSRPTMEKEWEKYKKIVRIKNLNFSLFIDKENDLFLNLKKHSQEADLVFLGMRPPKKEQIDEYKSYFSDLFKKTEGCHNVAFVLSGEKVNFGKIFSG
ncbi:MAG: amino acid permease [Chlamydiales bacterium]